MTTYIIAYTINGVGKTYRTSYAWTTRAAARGHAENTCRRRRLPANAVISLVTK